MTGDIDHAVKTERNDADDSGTFEGEGFIAFGRPVYFEPITDRKQEQDITRQRRSQVGTGDRAEKIRTYNFPQDRISDHRIGLTLHNLPRILEGELDELIDALATNDQTKRLEGQLA